MSDLMPCPFCGGSADRITITDEDEVSNVGGDVICCTKCDSCTRVFFGEKEGIEDAWNTRADLATERERKLVEALKPFARRADQLSRIYIFPLALCPIMSHIGFMRQGDDPRPRGPGEPR